MASAFALDKFVSSPALERVKAVSAGLPSSALRQLTTRSPVTLTDLAGIVAPRRTLDRRLKEGQPLTRGESDRLLRFIGIYDEATRILGSREAAMKWLRQPKYAFDGEVPLHLMAPEAGAKVVRDLFIRAAHGMLA